MTDLLTALFPWTRTIKMHPDLATCPLGRWENHLHLRTTALKMLILEKNKGLDTKKSSKSVNGQSEE